MGLKAGNYLIEIQTHKFNNIEVFDQSVDQSKSPGNRLEYVGYSIVAFGVFLLKTFYTLNDIIVFI